MNRLFPPLCTTLALTSFKYKEVCLSLSDKQKHGRCKQQMNPGTKRKYGLVKKHLMIIYIYSYNFLLYLSLAWERQMGNDNLFVYIYIYITK